MLKMGRLWSGARADDVEGRRSTAEWLCQLSGPGAQQTGVRLPEAVSCGRDQVPQRGHMLHVDGPAAGKRDVLVDVGSRPQKVANLVEGAAEAMGGSVSVQGKLRHEQTDAY